MAYIKQKNKLNAKKSYKFSPVTGNLHVRHTSCWKILTLIKRLISDIETDTL